MAPEGIINASNNGIRISSKKSGYISNVLETEKRSKTAKLQINTVNTTFIKLSLDIFKSSITMAASAKSINTNNRSSLTLQSDIKKISNARRITVIINQNTQLFNQDLILSMFCRLINKKLFCILNSNNNQTFNTNLNVSWICDFIAFYLQLEQKFLQWTIGEIFRFLFLLTLKICDDDVRNDGFNTSILER